MIEFSASVPSPPKGLSLKAKLAWEYFFGSSCGCWCCARTSDCSWIITDEAANLDAAMVYPDDDAFIDWLEATADEHLTEDPVGFLRCFVLIPEIIDDFVAEAMMLKM